MTRIRVARSVGTAALIVAMSAGSALVANAWADSKHYCYRQGKDQSPTAKVDGTLHTSSAKGATEIVEKLLNAGANPGVANSVGYAPLHVAAFTGQTGIVEALLNAGADPDSVPTKASESRYVLERCGGTTPLHYAAAAGHADIVDALLAAGADANAAAKDGTTPIHWADKGGHVDAVVSLLTAGAAHE